MDLSDFLHSPACPSRASGWSVNATAVEDLPCCVAVPLAACHRHYPGGIQEDQSSFVVSLDGGLPQSDGGSASAIRVFGACSTFTAAAFTPLKRPLLWPASSLSCPRQPFDIEGFRRFVTSPATSTASGRNDKIPAWVLHPQEQQHLSTAHIRSGRDPTLPQSFASDHGRSGRLDFSPGRSVTGARTSGKMSWSPRAPASPEQLASAREPGVPAEGGSRASRSCTTNTALAISTVRLQSAKRSTPKGSPPN